MHSEEITKKSKQPLRYPNLSTVLMVENYLKEHSDRPISLKEIREELPKKVMYQTLKVILEYLWSSGKIIYGPKGIQWTYVPPEHLKELLSDTIEV